MVVLVLKKCESYLYNESQFHIKYNNRTKHVLYIGIYPQYCIENISTQKKQDPIQEIREVLARIKDFFKVLIQPEPTYLGDAIPIDGDGDVTND